MTTSTPHNTWPIIHATYNPHNTTITLDYAQWCHTHIDFVIQSVSNTPSILSTLEHTAPLLHFHLTELNTLYNKLCQVKYENDIIIYPAIVATTSKISSNLTHCVNIHNAVLARLTQLSPHNYTTLNKLGITGKFSYRTKSRLPNNPTGVYFERITDSP